MASKSKSKATSPFRRRLAPPRAFTVGASVSGEEKEEIELALHRQGFRSASEGARSVLLQWARGGLVSKAA